MSDVVVGIIGGSGNYDLPGLQAPVTRAVETPYGSVDVTEGRFADVRVVHLSRHGSGHIRLSNQVAHHTNLAAMRACGVSCVVSLTVCGAVDPAAVPGSLIVFDDLYFPSNRLPDGGLATWHTDVGAAGRGHWIFGSPFSAELREVLVAAGSDSAFPVIADGCYGHVDGPRFNTRAEIAMLRTVGVTAVSQTAGPEIVLAGEAEIPYALVGYVTDFANGVAEPESVDALLARMAASGEAFAALLQAALPRIGRVLPAGIVHRFGS